MPMVSLGEGRWRILRRLLHRRKHCGAYNQVRNWVRKDEEWFDELVRLGLIRSLGDDVFVLTKAGVETADMGEVDLFALHKAVKESAAAAKR